MAVASTGREAEKRQGRCRGIANDDLRSWTVTTHSFWESYGARDSLCQYKKGS